LVDNSGDYNFDRPFVDRLCHWLVKVQVHKMHLLAIQSAITYTAFDAVASSSKQHKEVQYTNALTNYNQLVDEVFKKGIVHISHREYFRTMKGSHNKDINGKQIKNKYEQVSKHLCNAFIPNLPEDLAQIKSGQTLRDAFDKLLLTLYRKKQAKKGISSEEIAKLTIKEVPYEFQFKEQPEVFLLTMQIFYSSIKTTSDAASLRMTEKGATRKELKQAKLDSVVQKVKQECDDLTQSKNDLIEAQVLAQRSQADFFQRLADSEALERGMSVLDRLKNDLTPETKRSLMKSIAERTMRLVDPQASIPEVVDPPSTAKRRIIVDIDDDQDSVSSIPTSASKKSKTTGDDDNTADDDDIYN
jgi:hypothetical protein